eukprot:693445-Rhodomonas_salina.2
MMRNDKLVVAGFPVGSLAKQLGVRHGDILKSPARTAAMKCPALTSQMDVSQGKHPAGDLMLGTYGTTCRMIFLRVAEGSAPPLLEEIPVVVSTVACCVGCHLLLSYNVACARAHTQNHSINTAAPANETFTSWQMPRIIMVPPDTASNPTNASLAGHEKPDETF